MQQSANKLDILTIISTALGACLEWFDFTIYLYVTPMIAKNFFPQESSSVAILASFGIFAAGYLMRPLGGIIFGNLGDRLGRKRILKITTGLMAIPMLVTAVLPTYQQWGIAAIVILLLMRMLQGFSVGGEYTGVLVMLLEQAPVKYRGLVTSSATFVSGMGVLLSSLMVTVLLMTLGSHEMYSWGWRIPFGVGFVLALFAYFCQSRLHESPYFEKARKQQRIAKLPLLDALKQHPKEIFYVFILTGFLGIAYYLSAAFLPSYLITILHIDKITTMRVTTIAALCYALTAPCAGLLSDYIGRKLVLLTAIIGLAVLSYPLFLLLATGNLVNIYLANCVLMMIIASGTAAFVTTINELFPTQQRFSGLSAGYNVGNAIFGGTTPLVATYFITLFNSHFAPCFYLMISAAVTVLVVMMMPETNPALKNNPEVTTDNTLAT